MAAGRLSFEDAQRTVEYQGESGLPFGQAARKLGVVSDADIRYALAQQFSLHCLEKGDGALDPELIAAFDPSSEFVEQVRQLRGQVSQALIGSEDTPGLPAICVAGAERRAGRTFLAANLAIVFAQLGNKTLLIDADFLHPRIHTLFRLGNRAGLSTLLAQRSKLDAIRPVPSLPRLGVLPAGPTPPNPHDLLARPVLPALLRECAKIFEVIIIDTPAARLGSGALAISCAAQNAVLVARRASTHANEARAMLADLQAGRVRMLGAVFNEG